METVTIIDYTESLNQIIESLNSNYVLMQEIKNSMDIFNFLILSSIAIILGLLLVKDWYGTSYYMGIVDSLELLRVK